MEETSSGDIIRTSVGIESIESNLLPLLLLKKNKKKCFIATAAYGSYLDPHVKVLRDFRDKYLLTNTPGRIFVEIYYELSPPVADFISKHEALKAIVRWILTPIVYTIQYPILSGILMVAFVAVFLRKKKVYF